MGGGGKIIYSHGESNARGVMILLHPKFQGKISNIGKDDIGRWLKIDVQYNELDFTIFNIYAPNKDSPSFFGEIEVQMRYSESNIIILGDFNLTLENKDRLNTSINNNKSRQYICELMSEYTLYDVWRVRNEEKTEFSWSKIDKSSGTIKASRLDMCLATPSLTQMTHDIFFINGDQTDHRPLVIIFDLKSKDRGPGYWKLNNNLLADSKYVQEMQEELLRTIESTMHLPAGDRWEKIKKRTQLKTQKYSRYKSNEVNLIIGQLNEIIIDMESRLPLEKAEYELLEKSKQDFTEILDERTQSAIFRSKAKWASEGDRSSKYFFNLEKNRYNNKTCYQIYDENNQLLSEPHEIMQRQQQFYQELYSYNPEVEFTLTTEDVEKIKVPPNTTANGEQQLSLDEFDAAVAKLAKNKSPGPDGITAEFYQKFWTIIRLPYYQAIIESYNQNNLYPTAKTGILNLISKPNKDARHIKNLRPITLLNVDYKLL